MTKIVQLVPEVIVEATSLPDAAAYAGAFVRVGTTLYWSDCTTWHQVAPPAGGSGGGGGGELVIGIITD
jgi:hypothetical protein